MLPRRDLLSTVLIQGLGVLATLAVSVVVAHRLGAAGQGFWANFKTLLDFVAVVAAYGFPSAFPFLINVRGLGAQVVLRFTAVYGALLLPSVALALLLAWHLDWIHLQSSDPNAEIALLTLASVAVALHAMLRGLCLATASNAVFNAVSTALPLSLLAFLIAWPVAAPSSLMWAATAATIFGLVASTAIWARLRLRVAPGNGKPIPMRETIAFGGWNFAVAVLMAGTSVYTVQHLSNSGLAPSLIGCFSIAVLVQGALLTPANLAGPLVYNAWSRAAADAARRRSYAHLLRLSLVLSGGFVGISWLMMPLLPHLFGTGFEAAVSAARLVVLAVPLGYLLRLMANVLLAVGAVRGYALAIAARFVTVVVILNAMSQPTIDGAAVAWIAGEAAAVIFSAGAIRHCLNWSSRDLLGFAPAAVRQ